MMVLDDIISVVPKILEWSISIAILIIGLIVLVRWLRELMKQMSDERARMEAAAAKERETAALREAALNAEVRELFVQNLQVIQGNEQALISLKETFKDNMAALTGEMARRLDRLEVRLDAASKK